jgi:hypothetical protein
MQVLMFPINIVPEPRLSRYRRFFNHPSKQTEDNLRAVYLWNIALCQDLLPVMALLEIGLRNRVDQCLTSRYGDNWLDVSWPGWLPYQSHENPEIKKLEKAHHELEKKHKQNVYCRDQLVAQLSFGFWVKLLSQPYRSQLWYASPHAQGKLFPQWDCLGYAGSKPNKWLGPAHNDLIKLLNLRNRMFHHEEVFDLEKGKLNLLHQKACLLLEALCPDSYSQLSQLDEFGTCWKNGSGWQQFLKPPARQTVYFMVPV